MILYTQDVDFSKMFVIKKSQMIRHWPKNGYYCKTPLVEGIKPIDDILEEYLNGKYDYDISYNSYGQNIIANIDIVEKNKHIRMCGKIIDCSLPYLFANKVEVYDLLYMLIPHSSKNLGISVDNYLVGDYNLTNLPKFKIELPTSDDYQILSTEKNFIRLIK